MPARTSGDRLRDTLSTQTAGVRAPDNRQWPIQKILLAGGRKGSQGCVPSGGAGACPR